MKQLNLLHSETRTDFGGQFSSGRRKSARPLCTKRSLHLILKTRSSFALLRDRRAVERILRLWADRFGVRIYAAAVNADHVHVHLRVLCRAGYARWIRAATGQLAQRIRGVKFALSPYSRVVSWGQDAWRLRQYLAKNVFEAELILSAWKRVRDERRKCIIQKKYRFIQNR